MKQNIHKSKLINISNILNHAWKYDKNLVIMELLRGLTGSVTALIGVSLSKIIIDELTGQSRIAYLVGVILTASVIIYVCNTMNSYVNSKAWYRIVMLRLRLVFQRGEKLMKMDFQNSEDPKVMDQLQRSNQAVSTRISQTGCACSQIIDKILGTLPALIITIVSYLVIMLRFSPLIILFVVITIILQYWSNEKISKQQVKLRDEMAQYYRKRQYYEKEI